MINKRERKQPKNSLAVISEILGFIVLTEFFFPTDFLKGIIEKDEGNYTCKDKNSRMGSLLFRNLVRNKILFIFETS